MSEQELVNNDDLLLDEASDHYSDNDEVLFSESDKKLGNGLDLEFIQKYGLDLDEVPVKMQLKTLKDQVNMWSKELRQIRINMRILGKLYKQDMRKRPKAKKKKKKPSGVNKPKDVPETLKEFFDLESDIKLSRVDVVKKLYAYIKEKELQDSDDGRTITPNDELKELFSLNDGEELSFYNVQKHLKKLYNSSQVQGL